MTLCNTCSDAKKTNLSKTLDSICTAHFLTFHHASSGLSSSSIWLVSCLKKKNSLPAMTGGVAMV